MSYIVDTLIHAYFDVLMPSIIPIRFLDTKELEIENWNSII